MAVELPYRGNWYSTEVKARLGEERVMLVAPPTIFAVINMLGGLTIKAANSLLGY